MVLEAITGIWAFCARLLLTFVLIMRIPRKAKLFFFSAPFFFMSPKLEVHFLTSMLCKSFSKASTRHLYQRQPEEFCHNEYTLWEKGYPTYPTAEIIVGNFSWGWPHSFRRFRGRLVNKYEKRLLKAACV